MPACHRKAGREMGARGGIAEQPAASRTAVRQRIHRVVEISRPYRGVPDLAEISPAASGKSTIAVNTASRK
jgi:hypothetical protein